MRKIVIIFLILMMLIHNFVVYAELGIEEGVRSYILADFKTGQILKEYNIDEVVEMASISKLMSYLVIMDEVSKGNISLEDIIKIDKDTTKIKGSSFELKAGEEFTVEELLEAAIIVSGNDATYALAKHVAGTEEKFVKMMNNKTKEIGLKTAIFYNSTGLPASRKSVQNKMSTREIFELSRYIISKYPQILDITTIKSIEVPSREFFQRNTNPFLMEIKGVDGLKTGFTNKAGYCYVSTFNIEARKSMTKDLRLIGIVMGAKSLEERNDMARVLVEYGLNNYSNKIFIDKKSPLETLNFPKGTLTQVNVYSGKEFSKLVKNDDNIQVKLSIDEIELPVKKNTKVGTATVEENGRVIFKTNILIKEDVDRAKWYVVIGRSFRRLFNKIWYRRTGTLFQ